MDRDRLDAIHSMVAYPIAHDRRAFWLATVHLLAEVDRLRAVVAEMQEAELDRLAPGGEG